MRVRTLHLMCGLPALTCIETVRHENSSINKQIFYTFHFDIYMLKRTKSIYVQFVEKNSYKYNKKYDSVVIKQQLF